MRTARSAFPFAAADRHYPVFGILDAVVLRILIGIIWLCALSGLAGAILLPPTLDIYIKDRYFPIQRGAVIVTFVLLFVVPLLLLTVRLLRPRRLVS